MFFWTPTKSFDSIRVFWSLRKLKIIQKQNSPPSVLSLNGKPVVSQPLSPKFVVWIRPPCQLFPIIQNSLLFHQYITPEWRCIFFHTHTLVVSVTQASLQKTAAQASSYSRFCAVAIGEKNLKLLRAPWELVSPTQVTGMCTAAGLGCKAFTFSIPSPFNLIF